MQIVVLESSFCLVGLREPHFGGRSYFLDFLEIQSREVPGTEK